MTDESMTITCNLGSGTKSRKGRRKGSGGVDVARKLFGELSESVGLGEVKNWLSRSLGGPLQRQAGSFVGRED